jgi:DNA-binding transcriptional LysR family regulator
MAAKELSKLSPGMPLPVSWDEIRYFVAAARRGSLNAAADDAGVDHSTLSRRIRALEDRLGVRLLDRSPIGLKLTEDGKSALLEAEQMEAAAHRLVLGSVGNDARLAGTVRLSITEGLASHWLVSRLPLLRDKYPEIEITLESANVHEELSANTDISIRYAAPTKLDLVGRKGPRINFRLFGTDAYIKKFGLPKSILELGQHFFIDHTVQHHIASLDPWQAMLASLPIKLRAANYINVLAAMNAGVALSLQPMYVTTMAPQLIAADLDLGYRVDVWIIYHSDRRNVARIRAVSEELLLMGKRDQKSFFRG